MDLLDRLLGHDAWTTRRLLEVAEGLPEQALDAPPAPGKRSIRATFEHIIRNMEVWTDLMRAQPPRAGGESTIHALTTRLDTAAADLASLARGIEQRNAWDERWTDTLDEPPTEKTYGGAIAHVVTHSMHHRAQLIAMLRAAGVEDVPEGDVLSWENSR